MPSDYPLLTDMIHEMSLDSYGRLARRHELPEARWRWPANAAGLERAAALMTEDERLALVSGEHAEQQAVVAKYRGRGAAALNEFLGAVFDGDLHYHFYRQGEES